LFAESDAVMVQNKFKQYFNITAQKVKQAADPAQKRAILNESFEKMQNTLNKISNLSNIPAKDLVAVSSIQKSVQDKYNELNGLNGYTKLQDNQLNNFADYVQQDMEQADQWVTISVTTLLLVAILLILLLR
jgi:cell division protein FtsX